MAESEQPTLWAAPQPLTDPELDKLKLPGDVRVGDVVFRKGVSMLALINQHRALWEKLHNKGGLL